MEFSQELDKLLEKYKSLSYIRPSMLPDIDLYMDQVTTFMDDRLKNQCRYPEDKILTKTMINNYTKNRLLPPPEKKKYCQDHLVLLIYIYYLKNMLSINDIATLLKPMTEHYWKTDDGLTMKSIYRDIISMEKEMFRNFSSDIQNKSEMASQAFTNEDLTEEERNYLQNFALVTMLGFDVYLKKQMMETIIDDLREEGNPSHKDKT
ncbi:MAG: DUF1836 domain-containing protein [Clostridiales bacterium]|nr:DUF1836 domain-containing protein [Clostridiales bacterium]